MQTSSEEIALTTIFKSSSYITNKHNARKKKYKRKLREKKKKKKKPTTSRMQWFLYHPKNRGKSLITLFKALVVLKILQNLTCEAIRLSGFLCKKPSNLQISVLTVYIDRSTTAQEELRLTVKLEIQCPRWSFHLWGCSWEDNDPLCPFFSTFVNWRYFW